MHNDPHRTWLTRLLSWLDAVPPREPERCTTTWRLMKLLPFLAGIVLLVTLSMEVHVLHPLPITLLIVTGVVCFAFFMLVAILLVSTDR